jgi:hypothetical protein
MASGLRSVTCLCDLIDCAWLSSVEEVSYYALDTCCIRLKPGE